MQTLNKAQKEAVEYNNGPLIIVAGAGTGKTTVITQKIAYLIEQKLATPEEVLALTFTEKAADEMLTRVDNLIEIGYVDLQISTFHSFCQKILEKYALDIGLSNKFKLATESEAWMLMRKNLDKFNLDYYSPLGNPSGHIHELITHFNKCKDELITPDDYLNLAEDNKLNKDNTDEKTRLSEVANAYHTYNQLLLENEALDFGDLIFYTLKLLQTRENITDKLRKRFKYILIDEFQDVNWAQYQLVQLLAGENPNLTVVGDDDQSIYAFRGASVSNILRFKDDFPKAKEIVLNENYRSNQEILDTAYKLIQNNNPDRLEVKLKLDKKLISRANHPEFTSKVPSSDEKSVVHIMCSTIDEEVKTVVREIIRAKENDSNVVWDDFAILVRANSHSEPFMAALEKAGVPYEFLAASGLYRQPIVLDCINYFRVLENFYDSQSIYRLLCMPVWKINEQDMQKLSYNAKRKSVSFYEALKRTGEFGVSENGQKNTSAILNIIQIGLQKSKTEKPTVILYNFLEQTGLLELLTKEEQKGNREMIRQIYQLKEFFEYVNEYESETSNPNIVGFLEHFHYVLESGDMGALYQPSDTPDSVNIITVHKAKGLEFKYVFVVNLVEDRFPARRRGEGIEIPAELIKEQLSEGDSHCQEERRLFYVAITRAKEKLFLLSADDYGGARAKKISRFLAELGFSVIPTTHSLRSVQAPEETLSQSINGQGSLVGAILARDDNKADFIYQLPDVFSFSQIKSYSTCPYQYKLAHILKIPTKGSASFSFGKSVHGAMHKFYERLCELNDVRQDSLFDAPRKNAPIKTTKAPSLDKLLVFYEESWIEDWYNTKLQREEYYQLGKDILREFYKSEENNWTIPVGLESSFKIKIGNYLVRGQIDRIDRLPDGSFEIIDYKTGKAKEKVEGEDKDQLIIYQIALRQLPEYREIGAPGKLTFYYLNDNKRVSFLGNEKEISKLQEKLIKTIEQINSGNFSATPGQHTCKYCDFKNICQYKV